MSDETQRQITETSNNVSKLAGCVSQMQTDHREYMGEIKGMRKEMHEVRIGQATASQQIIQTQKDILKVVGDQSEIRVQQSKMQESQNDLSNKVSILIYTKNLFGAAILKWGGGLAVLASVGFFVTNSGMFK